MQPVDPWRSSPLLWMTGIILCTPLIVLGGVLVLATTLSGGLRRATRLGLATAAEASGVRRQRDVAAVLPLRPAVVDELETMAIYSRAG